MTARALVRRRTRAIHSRPLLRIRYTRRKSAFSGTSLTGGRYSSTRPPGPPRIPLVHRPEPNRRAGAFSGPFFCDSMLITRQQKTSAEAEVFRIDGGAGDASEFRSRHETQADLASRRRAVCWKNSAWLI